MHIFWQEYLHFVVGMFAMLVSVSSAVLFFVTYRYEKQMLTLWRAYGFVALAIAFFIFILERKFPFLELPALIVLLAGFFSIYNGVLAEPNLSHLKKGVE